MSAGDLGPALAVDRALCGVALEVDFLLAVTPVNVPQEWKRFHASGYRTEPAFRYRETSPEIPNLRRRLQDTDPAGITDPELARLMDDKKKELCIQLDCLEYRNTPAFLKASIDLYGGVEPDLSAMAVLILQGAAEAQATATESAERRLGSRAFARRAHIEMQRYRVIHPAMGSKVQIVDEIPGIMAFEGDLLVGRGVMLPSSRVEALIQHEVGTHVVTYCNGGAQTLRMLQVGLPGYEETQEALAVFSEYVVGGLTQARLAQLAARVVAVEGLLDGGSFVEVFNVLKRKHGVPPRAAYQVVSRVFRSGGLTKDAIYLRGIAGLLDYLAKGGDLEPLFIGKLPVSCVPLMPHLQSLGLIHTPPLRPRWADEGAAQPRIAAARRGMSVTELTKEEAA